MDYRQAVDYLYSTLPMFHRIGPAAYKKDLQNILQLCDILGHPQQSLKAIHVAGTNGKGSVSAMLTSILSESGLKCGLFTSPHLKDFRERIQVNGKLIDENFITHFVLNHKNDFEKIKPSFFEWTVALAFQYFKERNVDICVVETGLGGRLDSTNIINPMLSVITNIGWDHANLLGNSLQLIGQEKAGIIKPGIPVVIGERQVEVEKIFIETANHHSSPISFASDNWHLKKLDSDSEKIKLSIFSGDNIFMRNVNCDLTGDYQVKNIITVMECISQLNARTNFTVRKEEIRKGLSSIKKNTGILGRWQILSDNPFIVCDVAHNAEGIREVIKQVYSKQYNHIHIVFGMVEDKNHESILRLLPHDANYYFCCAKIPRAMNAEILKELGGKWNLKGNSIPSVSRALQEAKNNYGQGDIILVTGSFFVVAEILN